MMPSAASPWAVSTSSETRFAGPSTLIGPLSPKSAYCLMNATASVPAKLAKTKLRLGVLDGGEVRRVVRVAERREGLADHGAARRGEGLLEMRRRLLAEGEVEHADIAAVAELGLGPGPERRGRLPGAVREAEVVAAAALLGEEVIGGDGVEPEALGVHDVVPDGRRHAAVDRPHDHVHVVLLDELAHLADAHARIRGVVFLDDRVGAPGDLGSGFLGAEHEPRVGVLAEHREGLGERQQDPDLDGLGGPQHRAGTARRRAPSPPSS